MGGPFLYAFGVRTLWVHRALGCTPERRTFSIRDSTTRRAMTKEQLQQLAELDEKVHELRGYL